MEFEMKEWWIDGIDDFFFGRAIVVDTIKLKPRLINELASQWAILWAQLNW